MRLRKNILPTSFREAVITGFMLVMIPLSYYVQLFVVIPSYYEIWSYNYNIHFIALSAITILIYSNLFATALVDPSIKGRIAKGEFVKGWKYCEKCDVSVPPRSWHCKICNICILKRDHHCSYMSCCIGFDNHKYFFMYLFYMVISTIYGTYFNISYIWDSITFDYTWKTTFKIIFPVIGIFFMEFSSFQFHLFVMFTIFTVGIFCGILLIWYACLMIKNFTLFERSALKSKYDKGMLKNIKLVLGNRWYLVWLGPWVDSTLPTNGMNWDEYLSMINVLPKTRSEVMLTGCNIILNPLNYYVGNFVLLPSYYKMWSTEYNIHFALSTTTFVMMFANMLALIFCDTSVKGRLSKERFLLHWKFCEKCNISVPPRSWHCNICDTCILKRDHHCYFTSCCVGLHNHRYFFIFLLYGSITSFYCTYFYIPYLWEFITFEYTWKTILKLLFPIFSIFFINWSSLQFHLFILFEIICFGTLSSAFLIWNCYLMSQNLVTFQKRILKNQYEKGLLDNIKVVFGERWYLVWLGPWVNSPLPCDGMNW